MTQKNPQRIGLAIVGAGRVGLMRGEIAARFPEPLTSGDSLHPPNPNDESGSRRKIPSLRQKIRTPERDFPASIEADAYCKKAADWIQATG